MKIKSIIAGVFCALGACLVVNAQQEVPASPSASAHRYLQAWTDLGYFSGQILIARGDQVLLDASYGLANRELGVPVERETKFNIASITKPMTLIAGVRMMEAGKLTPTDRLSKFVPDFPRGAEITVEHLMRHRAGIPHRVTQPLDTVEPVSAARMVELASTRPLLFEPGEKSIYSSAGYSVLARVLEIAAGESYRELLDRYVLTPAGMASTAHADSRTLLSSRADGYVFSKSGLVNAPLEDKSYLVGAGSVYSNARDLFALQRALLAGTLGEGAKLSLLRDNGLRWNGSTAGFRAFADWDKDTDLTLILVSNLPSGANDRIRTVIAALFAGETAPVPAVPAYVPTEISIAAQQRYEGLYEFRPGSPMTVKSADGGLTVNSWYLRATSETTFFSPTDFGVVEVKSDEQGNVTHFEWTTDGASVSMTRVASLP